MHADRERYILIALIILLGWSL